MGLQLLQVESIASLANATHNFKWVKITDIYLIWDQTFQIMMFKPSFYSQ